MIPSHVIIGGNTWTITAQPELEEGNEGLCDFSQHRIYICSSLSPARQEATLIHEAIHALSDFVGVEGALTEEEFATRLAPALTMFLKQNGWFKA